MLPENDEPSVADDDITLFDGEQAPGSCLESEPPNLTIGGAVEGLCALGWRANPLCTYIQSNMTFWMKSEGKGVRNNSSSRVP